MLNTLLKQNDKSKYDRVHVVSSPEATLADLIANPPEGSIRTTITPKLAEQMLGYNTHNRPMSPRAVQNLAREMKAGRWVYTREPIIFSEEGILVDGQHRLSAVVSSQKPIEVDVAFGAPKGAFAYMNMGKKRGASDIFAINGVKDYTTISAAIGWVHVYLNNTVLRNYTGLSPSELYEVYLSHTGIHDSLPFGKKFNKGRIASQSMMTALHYICAQKCRRDADDFFTIAGDGFGASRKSDPALTLRNKLIDALSRREKMHRSAIAGLTINAWNLRRAGLSGRGLKYDPQAAFPRAR